MTTMTSFVHGKDKGYVLPFAKSILCSCLFVFFVSALASQAPPLVNGTLVVCDGESTTLTAVGEPGATFAWYDALNGGNLLASGAVFTTPALTSTSQYFVSQTVGASTSTRTTVTIEVNSPTPSQPTSVTATPSSICVGESSDLSAVVDVTNQQIVHWYDAPTGGNLLGTSASGAALSVSPSSTTTYYAQSEVLISQTTFNYTGGVQTFTVPSGIYSLDIDAYGGRGGRTYSKSPGLGGRVQASLSVTPGQVLQIYVGGRGQGYQDPTTRAPYSGGWNGGGSSAYWRVAAGGGATDIRIGGNTLNDRILVAGAGGGVGDNGYCGNPGAPHGGGLTAAVGGYCNGGPGAGTRGGAGTQSAGGSRGCWWNGSGCGGWGGFGQGGNAGSSSGTAGGAGGAGWYGGGGGTNRADGGGGSSYTNPSLCSNVIHTQGVRNDHGLLIISYSVAPNCASSTRVPVTLTVNPLPTVSAGSDVYSCPGAGVTLTASGADTYSWEPGTLSGASISVDPASTTNYTVRGTITATGCSSTDNVQVSVSNLTTSADVSICEGQQTTLTASGAASYTWEPGTLTGPSINVSPSATTTYTVTSSDPAGCTDSESITVTVNPVPTVSTSNDTIVGKGFPANISASGAENYSWSPGGYNTASATVSPLASTTYTVTGSYAATGCGATASVRVDVVELPTISGDMTKLMGENTQLTATGPSGSTFQWYDAISGGNLLGAGSSFTTPTLMYNETYYVALTDGGGLQSPRIGVNVTVVDTTLQNVTALSSTICPDSTAQLTALMASPGRVNWYDAPSGGNLLGTSTNDAPLSIQPTASQTFYAVCEAQEMTETFNYTGSVQTFTVPDGVTSLQIDAYGGRGGRTYSKGVALGGRVQATLNVTPGQVLNIYVGGRGQGYQDPSTRAPYPGGWNGGGSSAYWRVAAGGGATDIRIGGTTLNDRILVAGGGGGVGDNGSCGNSALPHGGGLTGAAGAFCNSGPGAGTRGGAGSQTAGGSRGCWWGGSGCGGWGGFGQGGNAGSSSGTAGGAGGGGWYGGGGGTNRADGGGGSSYTDPILCQNVVHTQGVQNDNGVLIIRYAANGLATTRTATSVTVEDSDAPMPDLPSLPDAQGQYSVTLTPPTAIDNCIGTITATTSDPLTYNQQGIYLVTWLYDDGNGNQVTQMQNVRVLSVLPVEFGAFELDCKADGVHIAWTTETETNNHHFEVQGSHDGMAWDELGQVPGAGNSAAPLSYQFTVPPNGPAYQLYRLQQVDYDGTSSYSPIKQIDCGPAEKLDVSVYPNPTTSDCHLVLRDMGGEEVRIQLKNESGQLLQESYHTPQSDSETVDLSLADFPSGVYSILIQTKHQSNSFRLIRMKM